LLQASIVAVNSDWFSLVSGNPPEKSTTIFRPGTVLRFFARLRIASSMLRAPKSASALPSEDNPVDGKPGEPRPAEATVTGPPVPGAFGSTEEFFTPDTAACSKLALAVKFCTILKEPPKSTTAIRRSGPAFASINFFAAPRA
jgi:hypothetical protein